MDIIKEGQFRLTNLSKINILLGKNGCGKSSLLKKVEEVLKGNKDGEVNYVTPERGGSLSYNSGVEQNSANDENWASSQKRANQWIQFKSYSISQFRKLELLSLREIEKNHVIRQDLTHNFDTIINQINSLLTNVRIERTNKGDFEIFHRNTNTKLNPSQISSGESELIALTIECLTFAKTCQNGKNNYLFLDEPDVHLHPDLQANFIQFLIDLVGKHDFHIVIATHSTPILGALIEYEDSRFAILENGGSEPEFKALTEMYKTILPIFGAHPLSNLFNQTPIFLVEGEDDVRIFQQAIRTSNGVLKLYPCAVGGIGNFPEYEAAVLEIISGVYDKARAYSLKDRDDGDEITTDSLTLMRYKTSCRAAENLILSDEVLNNLGTNWIEFEIKLENWLTTFQTHSKFSMMEEFKSNGYDRKGFDLKEVRNVLVGLTPSAKPWEIAVGQVIGQLATGEIAKDFNDNKICNYLGNKLSDRICQ
jgi:energy-coupling factor transporter ATP-binding protein EcfA2